MQVMEACVESGALRKGHNHANSDSSARRPAIARLQAEDASSVDSRASSGFGGLEFWDALRQVKHRPPDPVALLVCMLMNASCSTAKMLTAWISFHTGQGP